MLGRATRREFAGSTAVQAEERNAVAAVTLTDEADSFELRRTMEGRVSVVPSITREHVSISPVNPVPDPVRQGDTPARHPEMYVRREEPTIYVTPEDAIPPSGVTHMHEPAPLADMPVGVMMFPDGENRRLDDGRHA